MIHPDKISGRLGNKMFQLAYLHTLAWDGYIPDIYLQDESYFSKYSDRIRLLYGQDIIPVDMVAIHVRRGDYVGNHFYVNLWRDGYYQRAMEQFPKNTQFLVFSDDIEWCKAHFLGKDFEFCDEENDVKALNIMAGCKGIIIANSSFSWWGAFLGDPKKKVIAPKAWYTDKVERTKCPKEWIRV